MPEYTTTRYGIRVPIGADLPDFPALMGAMGEDVDGLLTPLTIGSQAEREATPPGNVGREWYESDTGKKYLDIGTDWVLPNAGGGGGGGVTLRTARARTTTAQVLPANGDFTLDKVDGLDIVDWDEGGCYDDSASRYTADTAGYYCVSMFMIGTTANTPGSYPFVDFALGKNGTPESGGVTGAGTATRLPLGSGSWGAEGGVSDIVHLGIGDYLEVFANCPGGAQSAHMSLAAILTNA